MKIEIEIDDNEIIEIVKEKASNELVKRLFNIYKEEPKKAEQMNDKLKPNPCCGRCKYFKTVTGQGLYDDDDGYCRRDGTNVDTTSYCKQFELHAELED